MKTYTFEQARKAIVKASVERNTIELPAILSCIDLEGLRCLEYSRRGDARLAVAFNGHAEHITFLTKGKDNERQARELIKRKCLEKRIKVALCDDPSKSFGSEVGGKFDLVYGEWLSHKLVEDNGFLDNMMNHSRKYILLVMPGLQGDDAELAQIANPNELSMRKRVKRKVTDYLAKNGWRVYCREGSLRLDFPSLEVLRKTMYCLAFSNNMAEEQRAEADRFLDKRRVHNFRDDFYVLWAEKRS